MSLLKSYFLAAAIIFDQSEYGIGRYFTKALSNSRSKSILRCDKKDVSSLITGN
jgi:hypothetical protein